MGCWAGEKGWGHRDFSEGRGGDLRGDSLGGRREGLDVQLCVWRAGTRTEPREPGRGTRRAGGPGPAQMLSTWG